MTYSPPQSARAGQPYYLFFEFLNEESGTPTDPDQLTLDLTYGNSVGVTPDVAGPFTYTGASAEASDTIWRTGQGLYTFRWDVPTSGLLPGVYVASWSSVYESDTFIAEENFPISSGAPFEPVQPGDAGYWTGSITYQPPWLGAAVVIPLGGTDANGITWLWQSITGWDSPPSVGSVIQRSADHGGWAAPQFYGPRILTLTVMAQAATEALRDVARGLMQLAIPVGTSSTDMAVLVRNEPVPKQITFRRNASASVAETSSTLTDVTFAVPIVAPDPRKYAVGTQSDQVILPTPIVSPLTLPLTSGLPVTAPGGTPPESVTLSALNAGTFETRPQISLSGPITGPAIVNATTGQQISYSNLTLGPADVLTIDTDNRQSFVNGVFTAADPFSSWWVLQGGTPQNPGLTTVFASGTTPGGAILTMTWSSAWV